jgi:hypothetical protein
MSVKSAFVIKTNKHFNYITRSCNTAQYDMHVHTFLTASCVQPRQSLDAVGHRTFFGGPIHRVSFLYFVNSSFVLGAHPQVTDCRIPDRPTLLLFNTKLTCISRTDEYQLGRRDLRCGQCILKTLCSSVMC